jgi:very-short-patch-repair endonuclease
MTDYPANLAQQCVWAGLPAPKREYKFHPVRRWRFDLAWDGLMLAVEVDGGIWTGGRHGTGSGITSDCEKYNEAVCLGWIVLRVTPDQVESGMALKWIETMWNRIREDIL